MTKEQVQITVEYKDHDKIVLTNIHGDTYTSRSEELQDFFHKATSPEAAAYHGQGCDPDFTLWVVVNKWEYDYRTHEWVNNYIKEVAEASMKHSELYQFYLKRKPLQSPPQTDQP